MNRLQNYKPKGRMAAEMGVSYVQDQRFHLNSGATILAFDTSSSDPMYQLVLADRRLQIDADVRSFLEFLRVDRSWAEIVSVVRKLAPSEDPERRARMLLSQLTSNNAVLLLDETGCELPADPRMPIRRRKVPLAFHVRLLKREHLLPVTARLKCLFNIGPATALLAVIILTHAVFLLLDKVLKVHYLGERPPLSADLWTIAVVSVYLSLLFHEIGHCSACERFGVPHGEIGAGVFFIYPVLYADVGQCWSLSRLQRAVVDSAGIYFQFLLASLGCLLWIWTGDRLVRIFIYSMLLSAIFNLNPFLRMDGHWLLADLIGIPNLYRASNDLIAYACKRAMFLLNVGGKRPDLPDALRRPGWVVSILAAYCLASTAFFGYFSVAIVTKVIPRVAAGLPRNFALIWKALLQHDFSAHLTQLLIASFFLSIAGLGSVRFILRMSRRAWQSESLRATMAKAYWALAGSR
ncbi:MAG: hypothetical protein LAP87_08255 [Acidobacteriia bacterium]|nr:hypothetical protein [Terriglobia bacterium]